MSHRQSHLLDRLSKLSCSRGYSGQLGTVRCAHGPWVAATPCPQVVVAFVPYHDGTYSRSRAWVAVVMIRASIYWFPRHRAREQVELHFLLRRGRQQNDRPAMTSKFEIGLKPNLHCFSSPPTVFHFPPCSRPSRPPSTITISLLVPNFCGINLPQVPVTPF